MKSNYEIKFVAEKLPEHFRLDCKDNIVEVNEKVRDLREDLRSIVIDEAVRVGENYEQIKGRKEVKDIKELTQEAREKAKQTSLSRYGELRNEAFDKLNRITD